MSEIGQAVREQEKARRDRVRELMAEYDRTVHYPRLKELREQCGASVGGHHWQFSHLGPLSHPWFFCSICGKQEMRDE